MQSKTHKGIEAFILDEARRLVLVVFPQRGYQLKPTSLAIKKLDFASLVCKRLVFVLFVLPTAEKVRLPYFSSSSSSSFSAGILRLRCIGFIYKVRWSY